MQAEFSQLAVHVVPDRSAGAVHLRLGCHHLETQRPAGASAQAGREVSAQLFYRRTLVIGARPLHVAPCEQVTQDRAQEVRPYRLDSILFSPMRSPVSCAGDICANSVL